MATDLSENAPRRCLILRGGALGDFLVTVPALQAIRAAWPAAMVELWCPPAVARLAALAGLADRTRSLDRADMAEWFVPGAPPALAQPFDAAVSLVHDPDGVLAANLGGAGIGHVLAVSPLVTQGHASDHCLQSLAALGIPFVTGTCPRITLPDAWRCQGLAMARAFGDGPVAIHSGSGSPRKNWPLDRYLSLAGRISRQTGRPVVFLAGEVEEESGVRARLEREGQPVVSGCTVEAIAAFLLACAGYVGNDSGVTHLAAALGTPVVAVFGPTDPAVWAPRGPNVRVVQAQRRVGGDLAAVSVEDVVRAFASVSSRTEGYAQSWGLAMDPARGAV